MKNISHISIGGAVFGGAVLALLAIQPSSASIVWGTSNAQYTNVNWPASDPTTSTVTGDIGNTGITVTASDMMYFTDSVFIHAAHGVATIESGGNTTLLIDPSSGFTSLTLTAQPGTFWSAGDFKLDEVNGQPDGHVLFVAYYNGVPLPVLGPNSFAISSGQNPYDFITFFGETVDKIVITSDVALADLKQLSLNPVPLPAALPLFASGAGVMGLLGWWRKKRKAAAEISV